MEKDELEVYTVRDLYEEAKDELDEEKQEAILELIKDSIAEVASAKKLLKELMDKQEELLNTPIDELENGN